MTAIGWPIAEVNWAELEVNTGDPEVIWPSITHWRLPVAPYAVTRNFHGWSGCVWPRLATGPVGPRLATPLGCRDSEDAPSWTTPNAELVAACLMLANDRGAEATSDRLWTARSAPDVVPPPLDCHEPLPAASEIHVAGRGPGRDLQCRGAVQDEGPDMVSPVLATRLRSAVWP